MSEADYYRPSGLKPGLDYLGVWLVNLATTCQVTQSDEVFVKLDYYWTFIKLWHCCQEYFETIVWYASPLQYAHIMTSLDKNCWHDCPSHNLFTSVHKTMSSHWRSVSPHPCHQARRNSHLGFCIFVFTNFSSVWSDHTAFFIFILNWIYHYTIRHIGIHNI